MHNFKKKKYVDSHIGKNVRKRTKRFVNFFTNKQKCNQVISKTSSMKLKFELFLQHCYTKDSNYLPMAN
jgi:hypothetical protein